MNPLDAAWHLLNFLAPPLWVAAVLVALAKGVVWRRLLAGASWQALWGQSALLGLTGQLGALILFGAEGTLLGYLCWVGLLTLPIAWRLVRN